MADHSSTDPGVERILLQVQELNEDRDRDRRRDLRRRLLLHETTATIMLGSASLALAIVMVIVTLMGLFGISFESWSEERRLLVQSPTSVTGSSAPILRTVATGPVIVASRKVWIPSDDCTFLAFLGLALGGMGIGLSLLRRDFSWLSAIGFTLILLMMVTVVAFGTLMGLER